MKEVKMKSGRLFLILITAVIITALLSSCNMPFAKPVQIETEPETTTLPQADLSVWADKYEEFLLSVINGTQSVVGYELEVESCRFGIRNIDSDAIPELLISEGDFPGSKVSIFGYDGFEIRLIGSAGENGDMEFIPGNNRVYSYENIDGQESVIIYSIEEYKFIESFNATEIETEEGKTYFVNGAEVSEEEYISQVAENESTEKETVGRNLYELKSEYVLPVIENNTELIDKAIEENSIRAEEESQQTASEEATPVQTPPEETAEYDVGIPTAETGTGTDTYPVTDYTEQ